MSRDQRNQLEQHEADLALTRRAIEQTRQRIFQRAQAADAAELRMKDLCRTLRNQKIHAGSRQLPKLLAVVSPGLILVAWAQTLTPPIRLLVLLELGSVVGLLIAVGLASAVREARF